MRRRALWWRLLLLVICGTALAGEAEWQQSMKAGAAAFQGGDYPSATRSFEQALKEARAFGEADSRLGVTLASLAALDYAQGRYAEAALLLRQAAAIYEKALGPGHPNFATVLANLAGSYAALGRYDEAEPIARRALAIRENAHGAEHAEVAGSLVILGRIERDKGRYAEAKALYGRAVAIGEKTLGPGHPGLATWLANLADLYHAQGRYTEAEPLYRRALAIWEKTLGLRHPNVAGILGSLARLYRDLGRYAEAESLQQRALAIGTITFGPESPNYATALDNLASVYQAQGRYGEAEPLYRRALAIREKALGPEHTAIAGSLGSLAALHESLGRYGDAEQSYRRALAINEKALGPRHPDVATVLNNLATLYKYQGRYREAATLYLRALGIYEKAVGPEHPHAASALNNLATVIESQRRPREAEPFYRRALVIWEKAFGPEHPNVATAVNNLAALYHAQGRYAEAQPLYQRTLSIREKALGPDHPEVGITLNNLAALYQAQGRYDETAALNRRALAILERTRGPEHPSVALSLNNIAHVYRAQNRLADALATARRSTAVLARRIGESAGEASAGGRRAEQRSSAGFFEFHVSLLVESATAEAGQAAANAAEAFPLMQRARSSETAEQLALMAARQAAGSDALAAVVRSRQDLAGRLARLDAEIIRAAGHAGGPAAKLREQEADVRREVDALDARIAREFPRYRELTNPAPLELPEAQKLLGHDEALVVFLFARGEGFVWAVRRDGSSLRRLALTEADLEKRVRALRLQLDPGSRFFGGVFDARAAHALYRDLLGPVAGLLEGIRHLIVVPDRALTSLPLAVLVTEAPEVPPTSVGQHMNVAWLAKRHAITTLPAVSSLRALRAVAQRPPGAEPFLGFGDPLFEGPGARAPTASLAQDPVSVVSQVRRLARLPETAHELRAIARALKAPESALYLGSRATESQVKRAALANIRNLAFSTHGLLAGDFAGVTEPALALTPPVEGSELDDGLLTASEIALLRLNAEWVILSACNTAGSDGTPGAEGLSGLAKAFFYAGARSLLVSHWPVGDHSSMLLTTRMFEETAKGAPKAEALQRSMLAVMHSKEHPNYAHPAFWAPFVVVGF